MSRVLAGTWARRPQGDRACVYTSDRGAVFATSTIDQAIEPGLRDARSACLPGVKPIAIAGGGSVCVERQGSDEYVVANLGSGGRLWLLLMAPRSVRPYKPELSAMVALAGAVPR